MAGAVTDILVCKTGVLTAGDPTVTRYHVAGELHESDRHNNFAQNEVIDGDVKEVVKDCILMNTDVTMEAEEPSAYSGCHDESAFYKHIPRGPKIDVALIKLLNGFDPEADLKTMLMDTEKKEKLLELPFDQKFARQVVAFKISDEEARVVVKGNPEIVIAACEAGLGMDELDTEDVLQNVIKESMAKNGLKCISYAYKDVALDEV